MIYVIRGEGKRELIRENRNEIERMFGFGG
jgi:hypothetical protein